MTYIARLTLNLLLSALSIVATLAVCEGGLRLMQHWHWAPVYNRKSLDKGDTPYKELNARLVRSSNPVLFLEFDPKDPNINHNGFRGADFPPAQKSPGTTRIAILGDSVAYGYSVPLEQTFARLLEQKLNETGQHYEVLNFAVCGYSTVAEVELYKTRVREYHPDIVLLAYVLNDPLPVAFVTQTVGAARKQAEQFKQLASITQLGAWAYLQWQTLMRPFESYRNYESLYKKQELWEPTQNAVRELKQLSAQDGAKLIAVTFPLLLDFQHYPMLAQHQQIATTFSQNDIPHLDLLDAFRSQDYRALRPHPGDDTHPNATGHALAAEQINVWLKSLLQQSQENGRQNR